MAFATDAIEQYRSLRRRALSRELTDDHAHEYFATRSSIRDQALALQQSRTGSGHRARTQARANVRLGITLHLGEWETDTYINDLSPGGCSLYLNREPSAETIPFDLFLEGGITVRGVARVVSVRPKGESFSVSLRFDMLAEEARSAIEDTVLDALVAEH